jgi:hypothetical protein
MQRRMISVVPAAAFAAGLATAVAIPASGAKPPPTTPTLAVTSETAATAFLPDGTVNIGVVCPGDTWATGGAWSMPNGGAVPEVRYEGPGGTTIHPAGNGHEWDLQLAGGTPGARVDMVARCATITP